MYFVFTKHLFQSSSLIVQVVHSSIQTGGDQAPSHIGVFHGHSPIFSFLQLLRLLQNQMTCQNYWVHISGLKFPRQQEVHLRLGLFHLLSAGAGLQPRTADECTHL